MTLSAVANCSHSKSFIELVAQLYKDQLLTNGQDLAKNSQGYREAK